MPSSMPTVCSCGGVRHDGACDRCGQGKGHHARKTTERGYGWDWQQLTQRIAAERPLCEVCEAEGMVKPADHRHHIEKIKDAPHKRLDAKNIMSVCERHHAELDQLYDRDRASYWTAIQHVRPNTPLAPNRGGPKLY